MARVLVLLVALAATGCSEDESDVTNGRLLWNSTGCAYFAEHHIGRTSVLTRAADADKVGCRQNGQ